MQGTIKEKSFGSLYSWTWAPFTGDNKGLVKYLQSEWATFNYFDFRKHELAIARENYTQHKRNYHIDNEHPNPPKGSIPRLRGTINTNNEGYVAEPYVYLCFVGFENFTIYTKSKKLDLMLEEAIDQLTPDHFKPIEERNGMHLQMLTPRHKIPAYETYKTMGVAF